MQTNNVMMSFLGVKNYFHQTKRAESEFHPRYTMTRLKVYQQVT